MKKRKDFLIFGSPRIEEAEIREVEASLRSGWLGTGPKVDKFQQLFREHIAYSRLIQGQKPLNFVKRMA